jgi:hypothetical protein
MNLPIYQQVVVKSTGQDELRYFLSPDMNLRFPWAINLLELDMPDQLEVIGLIENYFASNNISYLYPYPVFVLSALESTVTQMPLVNAKVELPRFFAQKDNKTNVMEANLLGRNKLLQQEIKNCDSMSNQQELFHYTQTHRQIYELELERSYYYSLLERLKQVPRG